MDADQVARIRLARLGLVGPAFAPQPGAAGSLEQVVRGLGAVQAQDYGPAGWSIAQRTTGPTQPAVDLALAQGRVLRTHVLRPTWHLVLPEDLRRLLQVTAPRILARSQPRWRQLGLDPDLVSRGRSVLSRALGGGNRLTRTELGRALAAGGLRLDNSALGHLLMRAELEGLICSGGLLGKQQSYVLLSERLAPDRGLDDDAALAALTLGFFRSHGPATAKDLAWWATLTLAQVRRGLSMVAHLLRQDELDELGGVACWLAPEAIGAAAAPSVHLLQGYDEYTVAYTQTKYVFDRTSLLPELPGGRAVYNLVVIADGKLAGHWKRTLTLDRVLIDVVLYAEPDPTRRLLLEQQTRAHGRFVEREPVLHLRVDPRLCADLTDRLSPGRRRSPAPASRSPAPSGPTRPPP